MEEISEERLSAEILLASTINRTCLKGFSKALLKEFTSRAIIFGVSSEPTTSMVPLITMGSSSCRRE